MKANLTVSTLPDSGILVVKEGNLLRLFFDFVAVTPTQEMPANNMYDCEGIDVRGSGYSDIVSGIVNDRYPRDKWDAIMANYQDALDGQSDLTEAKRAEYVQEYANFQAWRKRAKEIANTVING